jgi:hypothetical protein
VPGPVLVDAEVGDRPESVTGQVRWQVTGRKPTRNPSLRAPASSAAQGGSTPRFSQRWSTAIPTIQSEPQSVTVR